MSGQSKAIIDASEATGGCWQGSRSNQFSVDGWTSTVTPLNALSARNDPRWNINAWGS